MYRAEVPTRLTFRSRSLSVSNNFGDVHEFRVPKTDRVVLKSPGQLGSRAGELSRHDLLRPPSRTGRRAHRLENPWATATSALTHRPRTAATASSVQAPPDLPLGSRRVAEDVVHHEFLEILGSWEQLLQQVDLEQQTLAVLHQGVTRRLNVVLLLVSPWPRVA